MGGGQFKQAVKQIIEAESQPIKAVEARKATEESKLKLFQDFKSKFQGLDKVLAEISNFKKFRELKAELGDGESLMSVTLDKEKAEAGSYQIEIQELAARTSTISNGFEDPDDPSIGMGFVVINLPDGDSTEVFIDGDRSSLNGIARAINEQPKSPVRASVIRDESNPEAPWKLLMTAKSEGAMQQLEFPSFYFMDGSSDFYIDDDRESKNAVVLIDGFPIELKSNDIVDFLPGVNAHLKQAKEGSPFTLKISEDTQKVSGKVKALVDQINQVLQFITQQNTVDESSNTKSMFTGDSGLQNIEYRLRNLVHEGFQFGDPDSDEGARYVFLHQVGIEFDKKGTLGFNEEKFNKALETDFGGISNAVSGEYGFAYQLREVLSGYIRPGSGILSQREQGLKSRIKEFDRQIDAKTKVLERRQQSLTDQFSRLQGTLSNLQRQSQYLSANLPGAGAGGNLVSQLLGG